LKDWLQKVREFSDPNVVIVLVANKVDMVEEDDKRNKYGRFALPEPSFRRCFSDPDMT
jgi:GTPase SAR1 family protein